MFFFSFFLVWFSARGLLNFVVMSDSDTDLFLAEVKEKKRTGETETQMRPLWSWLIFHPKHRRTESAASVVKKNIYIYLACQYARDPKKQKYS